MRQIPRAARGAENFYIILTYNHDQTVFALPGFPGNVGPGIIDYFLLLSCPALLALGWLASFLPAPLTVKWHERARSCLGALLGIAFTGGLMYLLLGPVANIPRRRQSRARAP
ncbi:hypothetical protein [Paraburkholderia sp. 35.1]|uniref:hypothetical protein n=1 Tax=Paraburkholderia sp. 35.1 TaxID=2991058 RepID=UPI003D23A660